jgi:hypothetical protein
MLLRLRCGGVVLSTASALSSSLSKPSGTRKERFSSSILITYFSDPAFRTPAAFYPRHVLAIRRLSDDLAKSALTKPDASLQDSKSALAKAEAALAKAEADAASRPLDERAQESLRFARDVFIRAQTILASATATVEMLANSSKEGEL